MKRIYTRTGDRGTIGIHGGERVEKDDIRIEANGTIDELNAVIGIIRSLLPQTHDWQRLLHTLQRELMVVMSHVATPSAIRDKNPNSLSPHLATFCEQEMDAMTAERKRMVTSCCPEAHRFLPNCSLPAQLPEEQNAVFGL